MCAVSDASVLVAKKAGGNSRRLGGGVISQQDRVQPHASGNEGEFTIWYISNS